MSSSLAILVAGDVCIDWLSVPINPAEPRSSGEAAENWRIRGGRRMYSRHGGAWLTASLAAAAARELERLDPARTVFGPRRFLQEDLDSISPDRLIHSLVTLDRFRSASDEESCVIRVAHFEGFAGPDNVARIEDVAYDGIPERVTVVLLDDAGNGFRNRTPSWLPILGGHARPIVVHKLREPLDGGALGDFLRKGDLGRRAIVLLNVDELRTHSDGPVTRALSWEMTATQLVEALQRSPSLVTLLNYAHLIVPLGLEGTLQISTEAGRIDEATLWYCPSKIEGDIAAQTPGSMLGMSSAFAAALATTIADAHHRTGTEPTADDIGLGVKRGMVAAWRLFHIGFGTCAKQEQPPAPRLPDAGLFSDAQPEGFDVSHVTLNPYPRRMSPQSLTQIDPGERQKAVDDRFAKDLAEFRAWNILEAVRTQPYTLLAQEVVRRGIEGLNGVPVARIGELQLIDRREIESYLAIRNLIREFLKKPTQKRPLCLAVFGSPGAGKSFGVTQVAKQVAIEQGPGAVIESYNFNVSQWQSPDALARALHRVRDSAIRGNVPLVFFDEFDSSLGEQELGWLKFFLAPMEDGVFIDGPFTHSIGRAIFVFAGGIHTSFDEFQRRALGDDEKPLDKSGNVWTLAADHKNGSLELNGGISLRHPVAVAVPSGAASAGAVGEAIDSSATNRGTKARDFLSRLRGYVNVQSIGKPQGIEFLRRAVVLRSLLERKYTGVFFGRHARVSAPVLNAFLGVSDYRHGVRSMEAILDMSRVDRATEITASLLPPEHQLTLHMADARGFIGLLNANLDLGDQLDQLGRLAHESFLRDMAGRRDPSHPSLQPWERLIALYRNSNREQAAHVPVKLAVVGCEFTRRNAPPFEFTDSEVELLAKMEHDRWMEERRRIQPDHPLLVPWDKLPEEEKNKDILYIRRLPDMMKQVGLSIRRLQ